MATQPTEECKAAGPPKKSNYKPKGKFSKLQDLPIYEVGTAKKVIIFIYDIFGWNEVSKNVFEFADDLAGSGPFSVIMPDFYRGEPWSVTEFPPQSDLQQNAFETWLKGVAADIVVRKDIYEKVLPHLQKANHSKIGVYGVCWGGKQAFLLGADADRFNGVASIHGAWIDEKLADSLQVPVYYGPAAKDTTVEVVKAVLDKKKFGKRCKYEAFLDQQHGFCAARGDWKNKAIKKGVDKAMKGVCEFFNKSM
eukprot:CAMPEP_0197057594 /NCGR_PEP_ID=MMETSP1384-20130603/98776_1 /TAXON_ID=29189 /ORGANISM="Ammonia sp." /LENGTH=250 /DNA_ID=CAMNT_0042492077 /DNA_START=37 /DNA_END=789 /DNA_ORIENTATION=-